MTDEERVLAGLIENGVRNDLRVTEEAAGYFKLVEAGRKIKDLAQSGRTSLRQEPEHTVVERSTNRSGMSALTMRSVAPPTTS